MTREEQLIERIRPLLKNRKGSAEKKMFGGVCFMLNGNMCVAPWKGGLIVRLNREDHDKIQAEPFVKPMDITGKVMKGWAIVEPTGIASDEDLEFWINRAIKFVRSLPSKTKQ